MIAMSRLLKLNLQNPEECPVYSLYTPQGRNPRQGTLIFRNSDLIALKDTKLLMTDSPVSLGVPHEIARI